MVRRGRPLMRAAMVGGVAYHAGKNAHQEPRRIHARGTGRRSLRRPRWLSSRMLGQLKDAEVLTQEEFDAQKAQLLGA